MKHTAVAAHMFLRYAEHGCCSLFRVDPIFSRLILRTIAEGPNVNKMVHNKLTFYSEFVLLPN